MTSATISGGISYQAPSSARYARLRGHGGEGERTHVLAARAPSRCAPCNTAPPWAACVGDPPLSRTARPASSSTAAQPPAPHTSAFVISLATAAGAMAGEGEGGDGRQDERALHGALPSHGMERAIASARDLLTSASRRSVRSPRSPDQGGTGEPRGRLADGAGGVLVDQPVGGAAEPVARLAADAHALDRRVRPGELADELRVQCGRGTARAARRRRSARTPAVRAAGGRGA